MSRETTRRFSEVAVGETLPRLELPITVTGIVAAALATRDFQNVHHDVAEARALGSPHIFMNILTSNGCVERFVTDWAGPEARLRSVSIKLGVPNYPGDTMVMSGEVTACGEPGEQWVEVEVKGRNSLGNHVTGSVRLELP